MEAIQQFPPVMGARIARRLPAGLVVTSLIAIVLAAGFDLSSIASIGSAIALLVFTLVTAAHFRVRHETGAHLWLLLLAIASTIVVLTTFVFTTLVDEPGTAVTLVVIIAMSVIVDFVWKYHRNNVADETLR
jgi:peptidoglycan/LPS O-acetylase OafA/YrhL